MNSFPSTRGNRGFTLVELLVVMAIIGILAALLLPALNKSKMRAMQAFCGNNLSQQGIAFHIFGHDHNSKFPMTVSINEGGASEFVQSGYQAAAMGEVFYFGFHVFQTMSNELVRPQLLICPSDTRTATNFPALQNQNISYFFGANADFLDVNSILTGDRNLATNSVLQPTILQLGGESRLRWTGELHQFKGNVLFADGHVEEWNASKLGSAAGNLSPPPDLFMPSVLLTSFNSNSENSNSGIGGSSSSGSSGGGDGSLLNNANPPSSNASGNANQNSSSPFTSGNGNRGNSAPNFPGGKPNPMSPGISRNSGGINRNASARVSQNDLSIEQNPSAAQNVQSNSVIATDDFQPAMSPTDQKIVRVLRGTFEWSYLFLLLLLLLFLIYKLWQMLRRDEKRRNKNQNQLPPQP